MIPREELTSPTSTAASGRSASPCSTAASASPPLRADAGNEEGNLGDDLADLGQLLGRGRTHDQTDVVVAVPRPRAPRRARRGLAGEFEVLQVAPARVRGATEDEHALLLPVEERLEGVATEVRVHSDRVGAVERGGGVLPVVLPMSARLASKRTGTSFPWAYAIVSSNARQPSASS